MPYTKQTHLVNYPENEIPSDSNIIPYSQYLLETQNAAVQDTNSPTQQDAMILSVFEQLQSTQTEHMLTKPQVFYDNNLKQALGFQNPFYLKKAQQIRPMLYDGGVIAKETNVISIADSEKTLMLEEESRSKMLLKQSDPMVLKQKVNIKPINYAKLNRLSEDFGKCFIPQQELSDEQAFWLQTLHPNTDQSASSPVKIEVLRELFKRITPDDLTEGEWGFERTKAVFLKEIIPFLKTLKDISNIFDKDLLNEVTEVQTVFNQMKAVVQQYSVDKQCFEIQKKQFLIENDRLLDQIISQDIVNIVVNSSLDINTSVNVNSSVAMNDYVNYVEMCNKCLELEAELIKQHNMNNTSVNQTKPSFDQLFELNNLKVELQAKDITIEKLKANIKRLNTTSTTNSVKKDIDEIETINIELEHRAKEHDESLVNQLNQKSVEITNLNAQLQEKVFFITTLKNDLRKLKGKDIVDNAAQASNAATIALGTSKLDPITLAPKDKNNRETNIYYLKHTME
ncbi:hypothetical protein Tco_0319819 [Tanacetum coccineum]